MLFLYQAKKKTKTYGCYTFLQCAKFSWQLYKSSWFRNPLKNVLHNKCLAGYWISKVRHARNSLHAPLGLRDLLKVCAKKVLSQRLRGCWPHKPRIEVTERANAEWPHPRNGKLCCHKEEAKGGGATCAWAWARSSSHQISQVNCLFGEQRPRKNTAEICWLARSLVG